MAKSRLVKFQQVIGQSFRNKELLLSALTHPSYPSQEREKKASNHFQRLEFLGDSILNLFIAKRLYQLFPQADEGLLSRMRSILVSRKLLARIARSLRLRFVLLLGGQEQKHLYPAHEKILADAFEALVAAIYFDRGLGASERFLLKCFKPHFDQRKLFRFDPNPKSLLQEYAQKKYNVLPAYQIKRNQDGSFTAWVAVKRSKKTKGIGRTKQEAEIQAASALLKRLAVRKKSSSRKETAPRG